MLLSRKSRQEIGGFMAQADEALGHLTEGKNVRKVNASVAALEAVREICRSALAADRFTVYQETIETLLDALREMGSSGVDPKMSDLCRSLSAWLRDELQKEPVKKEVVFLPYKASMWDSLESIWQAAAADEAHCNAYVIPIPYADLTAEHTVREWHCEKDLFPDGVPILDYQSVDLEKLHPDVIFFHNPYDWANRSTTVDPRYYSERLKSYTDQLVYVPYFVSGISASVDACQALGVRNADRVIVESEWIKARYEAYYPGGTPPPDKFLAMGSPKYDKVCSANKEAYPLPKAWQGRISGKKIILYNTSLDATLRAEEALIVKLRAVLAFFRQRKDLLLWWRPHPLMQATLDSMRPQFAAAYRQIVREYCEEGWGIYDDTPELARAILWTDAYYGDESSVMWLYQATGKPIMVQEHASAVTEKWQPRWFGYLTAEGNKIWFLSKIFGAGMALFEMDLTTDQVSSLGMVPGQPAGFAGSYLSAYCVLMKIREKIIMAPSYSDGGFVEYDCTTGGFRQVKKTMTFWTAAMKAQLRDAFRSAVRYGDSVFFIGNGSGLIVEYNGREQRYFYHTAWAEDIADVVEKEKLIFGRYGFCLRENILYLLSSEEPLLIQLDLDTMRAQIRKFPFPERISYIVWHEGYFWLVSSWNKKMIRWDERRDAFCKIPLSEGVGRFPFGGCMAMGNAVWMFPREEERLAEITLDGRVLWHTVHDLFAEGKMRLYGISENSALFLPGEGRGFSLSPYGFQFLEIETPSGEMHLHRQRVQPFSFPEEKMQFWREEEMLSLSDFVERAGTERAETPLLRTVGKAIYQKFVVGA